MLKYNQFVKTLDDHFKLMKDETNPSRKIYLLGSADGASVKNKCILDRSIININQE